MEIEIQTNNAKMEVPCGTPVQHREEKILGKVSSVTEEKKQQKSRPEPLNPGDTVYFTAFTKQDANTLYICKGEVTKIPNGQDVKTYRVKVVAVGSRSVDGKSTTEQKSLVGRAINKRLCEIHNWLGPIMMPKTWLN